MRSILRKMKPQWKAVLLILLCLMAQAVCDLALPTYTSSLIDVGIQSSGVEYAAPAAIRSESFDAVEQYMTAEEKAVWQQNYTENGGVYTRNDNVERKKLDEALAAPIAQAAMAAHGTAPSRAELDVMGEQNAHAAAVAFVTAEYRALGIDLAGIQRNYLWRTGGKMLLMSLGMVLAAVLSGLLAARVGASIGRDLRAQVFDKVVHFSGAEFSKFSTASLITRSTGRYSADSAHCDHAAAYGRLRALSCGGRHRDGCPHGRGYGMDYPACCRAAARARRCADGACHAKIQENAVAH